MNGYKTYLMGFCPFEGTGITRRLLNASVSMDFKHRLGAPESQPAQSLLTAESVEIQSYQHQTEFAQVLVAQHRNTEMVNVLQFRRRMTMRIAAEEYATLQARVNNYEIISQFLHTINEQKLTLLHNAIQMFPNFSTIHCRGKRIPIRECANIKRT